MTLLRLATPLLAAFTLFPACDVVLSGPNQHEADSERQEVGSTSGVEEGESTSQDAETSSTPLPDPASSTTDAAETDSESTSEDGTGTSGAESTGSSEDTSIGAESSSDGSESSSDAESSSTGEPEPIETCEQLDPAACEIGMCAFDAELDAHVCTGESMSTPGVVLHPQDAMLRHLGMGAEELNVIEIPNAGTFGVSVVPQGIEYDTGIKLFQADGTLAAMSAKSGQDELEIQAAGPSVMFLVVVGEAEIEGDYFVTVTLK